MILDPTGVPYGSTLTQEQRIARLEQIVIAKNLMTTRGDMIRRGASSPERFGIGGASAALVSDGVDPIWRLPAGFLLGEIVGAFATSAGAGDKISVTVTDPPSNVVVVAGCLVYTTGGAGTQIFVNLRDGSGGGGTSYTGAYAHVAGANYQTMLNCPPREVAKWSGSKTFYLNLNNGAGTPAMYGNASGAPCSIHVYACR